MSWVESKTNNNPPEDDDDGLPMDLNLSDDDDDDGLPMELNLSEDDDDDGLPMDLNLEDSDDDPNDDLPAFESEFSKTTSKPKKKKRHKCLKLPLIVAYLTSTEGERRTQCAKIFQKAGRSRDTVVEAEIALTKSLKISREKMDDWCKVHVKKDIEKELKIARAGEIRLNELKDIALRLRTLKVKLKENNKATKALPPGKSTHKLAAEQKALFSRLEKDKSRQKVVRQEVVQYAGGLAEMEERLAVMSAIPKDRYTALASLRKKKKRRSKVVKERKGSKKKWQKLK